MSKKISHSPNYFRLLGTVELILFVLLLIFWFFNFFVNVINQYNSSNNHLINFAQIFLSVLELLAIIIFGPALALLFFGHADLLEKTFPEGEGENQTNESNKARKQSQRVSYSVIPLNTEVVTLETIKDVENDILIPEGQVGIIKMSSSVDCSVAFKIDGKTIITKIKKEYIKPR